MGQFQQIFLLQCDYARIELALRELTQLCGDRDAVVLIEDAVFALDHPQINALASLYVLHSDAHLIPKNLSDSVQSIDYDELAEMLEHADKVINWK